MASTLQISRILLAASLLLLGWVFTGPAFGQSDRDLDVNIEIVEGEIRAEVFFFVRAPRQRVWEVITDFERAPEFMRNMLASKIVSRSGDTLRVHQKDQVRFGPFTFPVETVKEIRLAEPNMVESRLVRGSLKKYDAKTELMTERGGTRIVYRSLAIPDSVLAGFVGESTVKRETTDRFKQLRAEILRREHIAAAKP